VIGSGGLWQAKSFDTKPWTLEHLTQNIHHGGPPKNGIPRMIGLTNIFKKEG